MIDDLLVGLFGEAVFGRLGRSRRARLLWRIFFGLLGAGLGIAGAVHFGAGAGTDVVTNAPLQASMVALFVFLAAFFLFNVGLGRRWKWPGIGFVLSFVGLFATRILFGA